MKQQEYVYGLHAVKTLLERNPEQILNLFFQQDRQDQRMKAVLTLADSHRIATSVITKGQLDKKVGPVNHQGIVAVRAVKTQALTEADVLAAAADQKSMILLILDGVQDPHNLGACLRSANAMGVYAVITPKDRAASVTDVVRKVACGAAEHTPVLAVTNLQRFLGQLKEVGVWLVGLAAEGDQTLSQVDLKGRIGIVMGNEGEGLRRLTKEACDFLVKIPMVGIVESLNVSVATGITLYEVLRQRTK